ncbi:alpha-amylase family glycosyl hydrolase [Desulfobacterales bacterium HSG2]|nr:alpha-amylase family glycosyl hydrolase [Desulfobacterales bacterium HSG2]
MTTNHHLYQINTRVFLRRFDTENRKARLDDIPRSYWEHLAEKGFDYIWLMGIWKICESTIEKYCFKEGATRDSFSEALKDFRREDVIGSPFAVDRYEVSPTIGTEESVRNVRSVLNDLGMKLILDFVPNHFSADSSLIQTDPYIFLEAVSDAFIRDPHTFYRPSENDGRTFAHGRDPFFPAWEDTVQVNYFNPDAREFMVNTLMYLTGLCDGVRCDVAMLLLNDVFGNTWKEVLSETGFERPEEEFWKAAVESVKKVTPGFIFIGEVYWDKEWELQQLGLDYTYDKRLTDRLKAGNVKEIRDHLLAETDFQNKSVRFVENHDEERAAAAFGEERSEAAAIIISTLQGMRFYHDGQFEGKKIRLPVQLGREPVEPLNKGLSDFYEQLLRIINTPVFKKGEWSLLQTHPAWERDVTYPNILAWAWKYESEKRLVLVNYSDAISTCRVNPDVDGYSGQFELVDLLNNQTYTRSVEEARHPGIYIELKSYKSHIFAY